MSVYSFLVASFLTSSRGCNTENQQLEAEAKPIPSATESESTPKPKTAESASTDSNASAKKALQTVIASTPEATSSSPTLYGRSTQCVSFSTTGVCRRWGVACGPESSTQCVSFFSDGCFRWITKINNRPTTECKDFTTIGSVCVKRVTVEEPHVAVFCAEDHDKAEGECQEWMLECLP